MRPPEWTIVAYGNGYGYLASGGTHSEENERTAPRSEADTTPSAIGPAARRAVTISNVAMPKNLLKAGYPFYSPFSPMSSVTMARDSKYRVMTSSA